MGRSYLFHFETLTIIVFVTATVVIGQNHDPWKKRDLADIRYKFTSCGTTGRSGPSLSTCGEFYSIINSPIAQQDLLFEFENREYEGAQGFRVPRNGVYNITVAGAEGARGICNPEYGGRGYQRSVQVELSTEYELMILVGQRGTEPCDVIPVSEKAYKLFCEEFPTDAAACNETWYNFTRDFDSAFYEAFGGGAGGGGSLVRARRTDTKALDEFPIILVGGGGGSASVLDHDAVNEISIPGSAFLPVPVVSYKTFVNGKRRGYDGQFNTLPGVRGARRDSSSTVAGAGGGYKRGIVQPINQDGRALGSAQDLARGGLDCTDFFMTTGHNFPYTGVYGGFGGGGGACGGGGGGGGYTGGAVLDAGVINPGGGGYSFIGNSFTTSFKVYEIGDGHLSRGHYDGSVEIILANCGCVHTCSINSTEDTFECICPENATLAPDLSDCFTSAEISMDEGSLNSIDGDELVYRFMEVRNATYILSNDINIHSDDEKCVLVWLGEDLQIVLITNVVRGSGKMNTLAVLEDVGNETHFVTTFKTMLTSSVLVTGALLVGTGNCSVMGHSISINASILTPHIASTGTEEFFGVNLMAVEQRVADLARRVFLEPVTGATVNSSGPRTTPGVVIAPTVVATILLLVVLLILVGSITYKLRSKRALSDKAERGQLSAAERYKDCLVLNLSYSQIHKSDSLPSQSLPEDQPDNSPHYHEVTPLGSELQCKGRDSPTEAGIVPVHGVTCPLHDFTSFNKKRRNTVVIDTAWDYPRGNLMYMRELGEGQFGKVLLMKAKDIAGYHGSIPVAVKTLTTRDPEVVRKFYEEADLMKRFSHPHIVSLLGFIREEKDEDSAPLMVLEFMQYGDLQSFMTSHRPIDSQLPVIGEGKFISFATDVAKGLEFLSSMKYVHRDIAARNCLVGAGLRIKIADFGLARAVHNRDYYKVGGAALLPVRWMAPESLLFGVFSSASDVWSYGVLLWEIVSYGNIPLGGTSVDDIIDAAQTRTLHHTRPLNCPDSLYDLISECLEYNSEDRPGVGDIVVYLSRLSGSESEVDTCTDSDVTASLDDKI